MSEERDTKAVHSFIRREEEKRKRKRQGEKRTEKVRKR